MSDTLAEGKNIVFSKEGEKNPSQVNILSERKIGEGNFGDAYETNIAIGNHIRKFVIKKFKAAKVKREVEGERLFTAQENAVRAMTNYQEAKRAGFKIFTTYRLGDDRKSVLMTNGNSGSTACLTSNESANLPSMGEPKIENIDDGALQKLADGVFQ